MIKSIDEVFCTNCGVCVDACQSDVLRFNQDGKVYIAYPDDCCHCLECAFLCPFDAITVAPGVPKKFSINYRWELVKNALNVK